MIAKDQPRCFPENLIVAVSSKDDGTVLDRQLETHDKRVVASRRRFCESAGVDYGNCVYQRIVYDEGQSYKKVVEVGDKNTTSYRPDVAGDALFTTQVGVGLFLPVADCLAMVIYDPKKRFLSLLHNGRHSSYAKLSLWTIMYFIEQGSCSEDLLVWMSPHAQLDSYCLDWFDKTSDPDWDGYFKEEAGKFYLDLAGYNKGLLQKAGVKNENIFISKIDTVSGTGYFSHSAGDKSGRFAVVAMMK